MDMNRWNLNKKNNIVHKSFSLLYRWVYPDLDGDIDRPHQPARRGRHLTNKKKYIRSSFVGILKKKSLYSIAN